MKIFVCVLCVVTVVCSTPVGSNDDTTARLIDDVKSCVDKEDSVSCLKEQALDSLLRLENTRSLKLFNGVTFINNGPRKSRSLEPLSTDADLRKNQITERLWKSTTELMESGDIEVTFGEDDTEQESRAINEVDEGRGKKKKLKKKLKMIIPLLILAKAKAVALVVLALLVIAASLFKLALLAKLAFIIKIIAIIKALLAAKKHHQEETWEIAAPSHGWEPHGHEHVEHGHGWEGGWSRSRNEGNNLAYSAYTN